MISFDKFQPNFLEMEGKISRKPFQFIADSCIVWHSGQEIFQSNSKFKISAIVNERDRNLNVSLDNSGIENFILNSFYFNEISSTVDRILWSKDIELGFEYLSRLQPGNMSLFYCNGILRRIYLNVYLPFEIMIEFNSDGNNDINEIENPLKKIAMEINSFSHYERSISDNYKIGFEKMELGDFESAITFFDLVINEDPKFKMAYYNRGFSKFQLNQYQDAIEDYSKTIELDSFDSVAYYGRGFSKFRLQDFIGAIKDLSSAIAIKPNDSDYYGMRANAKSNLDQFRESIDDYSQAIRLNPNNPQSYFNRGIARYNEGDENGAFNDWKIAGDMGLSEGYNLIKQYGN
jgi:tetratricopeptide (TPR) repeat protein